MGEAEGDVGTDAVVGTDVPSTKPCSPGTRSGFASGATGVELHNGLDNVGGRIDGGLLGDLCSLALLTASPPALHAAGRVLAHHAARCAAACLSKGVQHDDEEDDVIGHVWHHLFLHHLVLASTPQHAHERWGASKSASSASKSASSATHTLCALMVCKAEDTAEVRKADDTAEALALCKPQDTAELRELMFPRAVKCLRQMVQALLQPRAAQGLRRKRKAGELSGAVDALRAILQPTLDARQCAGKLARVVCSWMQTLPNVSKLLGVRQTTLDGGERAGHTVLAHLVYISVLWHLLPSASDLQATEASKQEEEEDKNVGDDLQAALLSGISRPAHMHLFPPCTWLACVRVCLDFAAHQMMRMMGPADAQEMCGSGDSKGGQPSAAGRITRRSIGRARCGRHL